MNVSELIQQLKTLPQDSEVMIPSYEEGLDPVTACKPISVNPSHTADWYIGLFAESEQGSPAVLIASKFTRAEKNAQHD